MLSEEKIKKMIRLSEYETGQGSTDLRRMRYLKMDYVRLQVIKTAASVFLAFLLILLVVVLYYQDYIMMNALSLPVREIVLWGGAAFCAVCAVSAVITCRVAVRNYEESRVRAKEYYVTLQELLLLYEKERQEDVGS